MPAMNEDPRDYTQLDQTAEMRKAHAQLAQAARTFVFSCLNAEEQQGLILLMHSLSTVRVSIDMPAANVSIDLLQGGSIKNIGRVYFPKQTIM